MKVNTTPIASASTPSARRVFSTTSSLLLSGYPIIRCRCIHSGHGNVMRELQKQTVVESLRLYLDRTQRILNIVAYKSELSRAERDQTDLLLLELGTSIDMERGRLHSRLYEANEYEEKHLKPDLERLRTATRACCGAYSRQWEDYLRDAIGEMTYSLLNLTAV